MSTDRVLPVSTRDDSIEDEAAQDPVKILQTQATFDDIVVWGHENEPESDDVFVKAVDEWIKFAETVWFSLLRSKRAEKLTNFRCTRMANAGKKARSHIECGFDYLMINYEGFQQPRRSVRVYPRATVRRFDLTNTEGSHQAIHCSDGDEDG